MRIGFFVLCFYWLSSSAVHASTLIDLGSSSCSDSQSLDSSDGLILNCTGDFSLSSGTLSSDASISLLSSRRLTLDAFRLSAPSIMLKADSIYINSNVSLIGNFIDLSANSIIIDGIYGDQPPAGSEIRIFPGRDIIKPLILPVLDGSITLSSGGNITLISSVPLPSSFVALLTGLLILVSVSGRPFSSKAQS